MPTPAVPTGTTEDEALTLTPTELEQRINAAKEQAAKDERDKLYGRIKEDKQAESQQLKDLKAEIATLTKAQKTQEKEREQAARKREEAERKAAEAELDAKQLIAKREEEWQRNFESESTKWQSQFTDLQKELENERAIRAKEAERAQISAYIQRRVAEEQDTIEPRLVKYIGGETPEAIELSIKQAQADSADIYKDSERHFRGERAKMPGTAPTGNTPTGPLEQVEQGGREVTAEDIKAMSMPEYEAFRKSQGIAASGQGKGLYNQ